METVVRVVERRAALAASLDRIRDGAMAYAREGRLLHRNPALAALARTRRDEARLLAAGAEMARTLFPDGDAMAAIGAAGATRRVTTRGGVYRLSAVRMGSGVFDVGPTVLVTVAAGPPRLPTRERIRERHGLTRRQAEVALLLARRKTNAEIAQALCISPHTAHHHTEAVLRKLGAENRRDVGRRLRGRGDARGRPASRRK